MNELFSEYRSGQRSNDFLNEVFMWSVLSEIKVCGIQIEFPIYLFPDLIFKSEMKVSNTSFSVTFRKIRYVNTRNKKLRIEII